MNYNDYVNLALEDDGLLKVILKAYMADHNDVKVAVVEVVYMTYDLQIAKNKISELSAKMEAEKSYYMIYSVPLDTDLSSLSHYPSIAIFEDDFK